MESNLINEQLVGDENPELKAQLEKKRKKEEKKRKKEEAKRKKLEQRLARERAQFLKSYPPVTFAEMSKKSKKFGRAPMHQSSSEYKVDLTPLDQITSALCEKEVTVRARIHRGRATGNNCFLVLRYGIVSVQAIGSISQEEEKPFVKFCGKLPSESIVDVTGIVKKAPEEIISVTQSDVEIHITSLYCISFASKLPLTVEDAMKTEAQLAELQKQSTSQKKRGTFKEVTQKVRLDNRVLDLRAYSHNGIMRVKSMVAMLFREYLMKNGFVEIQSPKLIATASEGGSEVFTVDYFKKKAFLAQSPQLYKQMSVQADLMKVFEVGPVFRAEDSFTNRHLTEFTGLDLEMSIVNHYHEVLDTLDGLFIHIFNGIEKYCEKELKAIRVQYPSEPITFNSKKNLILTYPEAIKMLHESGEEIGKSQKALEDLGTEQEKLLGKLVKKKFNTDFYILDKYPMDARPFYTMPCPKDPKYSNSYDLFIRGQEICSGAQRIHDADFLIEAAKKKEVDLTPIQDYVDCFKYGAWPHGGGGIGLDRVVMLYLKLPNIRKVSMYPRDPKRLNP